jgi:sulfite exporter TauE/SafE
LISVSAADRLKGISSRDDAKSDFIREAFRAGAYALIGRTASKVGQLIETASTSQVMEASGTAKATNAGLNLLAKSVRSRFDKQLPFATLTSVWAAKLKAG